MWYTWLHSAHARDFMLSIFCRGVSFLHWTHVLSGSGFLSRWINALGSLWLDDSVMSRMRPVRGCPWVCAGLSVIFWPCRCRYSGLSIGFRAACFHFAVLSCRFLAVFLVLFGIVLAMRRGVCLEWVLG